MDSLDVLRAEPGLALFPVVAGLAGTAWLAPVFGGAVLLSGTGLDAVLYAAVFAAYLGSAFVATVFSAALTYNAREVFHGRNPTTGEGLSAAWRTRGTLLAWALVAAVVGVVLNALESSDSPLADLAAVVFGVAWSALTYFVVPVTVFEDVDFAAAAR
jgi:hypothetical protein